MSKFIYISQGRTARFIKDVSNSSELVGLCTAKFINCNIIVLISADKSKMSLTHADVATEREFIEEEINWIGSDCQKIAILRADETAEEDFEEIFKNSQYKLQFSKEIVSSSTNDVYAVAVSDGRLSFHSLQDYKNMDLIQHPIDRIDTMRTTNHFLLPVAVACNNDTKPLLFTRLIFDGVCWGLPSEHDTQASEMLARIIEADAMLFREVIKTGRTPNLCDANRIRKACFSILKEQPHRMGSWYVELLVQHIFRYHELIIIPNKTMKNRELDSLSTVQSVLRIFKELENFVIQDVSQFTSEEKDLYEEKVKSLCGEAIRIRTGLEDKIQLSLKISFSIIMKNHKKNMEVLNKSDRSDSASKWQSQNNFLAKLEDINQALTETEQAENQHEPHEQSKNLHGFHAYTAGQSQQHQSQAAQDRHGSTFPNLT